MRHTIHAIALIRKPYCNLLDDRRHDHSCDWKERRHALGHQREKRRV